MYSAAVIHSMQILTQTVYQPTPMRFSPSLLMPCCQLQLQVSDLADYNFHFENVYTRGKNNQVSNSPSYKYEGNLLFCYAPQTTNFHYDYCPITLLYNSSHTRRVQKSHPTIKLQGGTLVYTNQIFLQYSSTLQEKVLIEVEGTPPSFPFQPAKE